MTDTACASCSDSPTSPICIPCGHIFCEQCLTNSIRSGDDPMRSKCPSCNEQFSTVLPNFAYIPDKYQPLILPSIRKLQITAPEGLSREKLHTHAAELEEAVRNLQGEKDTQARRILELNERLEERAKLMVEKETAFAKERQDLQKLTGDQSASSERMKAELGRKEKSKEEMHLVLQSKHAECADLTETNQRLKDDLASYVTQYKLKAAQAGEALEAKAEVEDTLTRTKTVLADMTSQRDSYKDRIQALLDEVDELREEMRRQDSLGPRSPMSYRKASPASYRPGSPLPRPGFKRRRSTSPGDHWSPSPRKSPYPESNGGRRPRPPSRPPSRQAQGSAAPINNWKKRPNTVQRSPSPTRLGPWASRMAGYN